MELYLRSPIRFYEVMLNQLSTRTTLPLLCGPREIFANSFSSGYYAPCPRSWYGYGLGGGRVGVRVPVRANFSPLHVVQTDSGAHPAYPMGTGASFPGGKATGV
jgi:hypothetical protein